MIYIVDVADHYYPSRAVEDWKFITKDFEKAKHFAHAQATQYNTCTVMRLDPETLFYDAIYEIDERRGYAGLPESFD